MYLIQRGINGRPVLVILLIRRFSGVLVATMALLKLPHSLKYFNDCLCNFLSGNIQYSKYYLYAYTFKIAHTRALSRELAKYDAAGTRAFLRIMSENSS